MIDPIRTPTARQPTCTSSRSPAATPRWPSRCCTSSSAKGWSTGSCSGRHAIGWDELEPLLDACTPEWGEADDRRAGGADRGGGARSTAGGRRCCGSVRACSASPGRQRDAGLRAAAGRDRQHRQARRRVPLPQRTAARHRRRLPRGAASARDRRSRSATWTWPRASRIPARSRGLFCWNINIAASNPEQTRLLAALAREDLFTVAVDLFQTDTTDSPTCVLPAASFLEFDDLVVVLLRPDALGPGQGGRADRRGAAQPGDLPPAGARHGLHRAGAVRGRPRDDRRDAGPDRHRDFGGWRRRARCR